MSRFFEVNDLYVNYGEAEALHGISLAIDAGQITTIIGANGAGKTTLVNTIAGILKPRSGEILLEGTDISKIASHEVCDYKVAIVPEGRRLFTKLSVLDNLKMGAYPPHARSKEKSTLAFIQDLFPRLAERRSQIAGTLSGGEQQMLALGRALMAQPSLLLLDEPSLGLAPIIVQNIFNTIQKINQEFNLTILLVEQNANLALQIADYAYVISEGHITQSGQPSELLADDSIKKAYLGIDHATHIHTNPE